MEERERSKIFKSNIYHVIVLLTAILFSSINAYMVMELIWCQLLPSSDLTSAITDAIVMLRLGN